MYTVISKVISTALYHKEFQKCKFEFRLVDKNEFVKQNPLTSLLHTKFFFILIVVVVKYKIWLDIGNAQYFFV